MAGLIPQSVQQVERQVEAMMEEVQKKHLIPKQKEAFLCCAKCCDSSDDVRGLQSCVERCSAGSAQSQKLIQQRIMEFQERFQRCAVRCQDLARDGLSYNSSGTDQDHAQMKFNGCMEECGKECLGRIPNLKNDIITELRRM